LVVLDGQDVIAAAGDDLGAEVALAEEGVASDDAAPQRQDAQQLQSGLVLVGLGIDAHLGQDGLGVGGIGSNEVLAGGLTVLATTHGLAVQGDDHPLARGQAVADPAAEGGLEGGDVQGAEEDGEGGLAGRLAATEAQGVGQRRALVASELGDGFVAFGSAEHGEDGQGEDGVQGVASALGSARVGDLGEGLEQGKGGSHAKGLRAWVEGLRRLPPASLPANLNFQTALQRQQQ